MLFSHIDLLKAPFPLLSEEALFNFFFGVAENPKRFKRLVKRRFSLLFFNARFMIEQVVNHFRHDVGQFAFQIKNNLPRRFLPTPGNFTKKASSSCSIASMTAPGSPEPRMASAPFGPMPGDVQQLCEKRFFFPG